MFDWGELKHQVPEKMVLHWRPPQSTFPFWFPILRKILTEVIRNCVNT